jgi:hypothetical protein
VIKLLLPKDSNKKAENIMETMVANLKLKEIKQ